LLSSPDELEFIMSTKCVISDAGLRVTTLSKAGHESTVIIAYDTAMESKTAGRALAGAVKSSASIRTAALSLIHVIQESGMLKPWCGGKAVVQDMLKKMKEAEELIGEREFGLTKQDWAELRKPGQYADTRSQAMKAYANGQTIKVAVDAKGAAVLLTTNGLRKINASNAKPPEKRDIDDYLDAVADYLEKNPKDAAHAQKRLHQIITAARSLLDSEAKKAEAFKDAIAPQLAKDAAKAAQKAGADQALVNALHDLSKDEAAKQAA
jgi:hypothetical protein